MGNATTHPAEMDPEDLPDVKAFQDEFTREFLESTEETRPGFYPFLSGKGAYTMDFPANGLIDERGYSNSQGFEGYLVGVEEEENKGYLLNVSYYSYNRIGKEKRNLEQLEERSGEQLEFEKIELDGRTLYIAPLDNNEYGEIGYAGYLQNLSNSGGIQIFYKLACSGSDKECQEKLEQEKPSVVAWMKSIHFEKKEKESE
ncbi:hypothetical protein [Oceanobacillus senegalensis]|uniref:hypothetical protein n=1 Tax=Oceanobacillus senegalensis TaxID=1936063 RepID=UPI000A30A603|nr:hypothetical protein [Oceanobacillus senegalensis]